jgi:hypothetical protein
MRKGSDHDRTIAWVAIDLDREGSVIADERLREVERRATSKLPPSWW